MYSQIGAYSGVEGPLKQGRRGSLQYPSLGEHENSASQGQIAQIC